MLPSYFMTDPRDFVHSLMNHLAVVQAFSELLLHETAADDPRRADLTQIHTAATAAVRLVSAGIPAGAPAPTSAEPPPEGLHAVERDHIVRVLAEVRGNKLAAARRLGISRRTLYRRLERHGLMGPH